MVDHNRAAGTRTRRIVRRIHLWLGIGVGLLFAVLGLTGSALVYYTDIDAALHPVVQAGTAAPARDWRSQPWDRALATGRARWPAGDGGGKWTFEATGENIAIPARHYAVQGHHADRMMVWFSADGSRIVRAEPWGGYVMSWIYQLHMQVLAGDPGSQIVGWSGVAMLVLLFSGIFAWWPRGSWRKALAFKRAAVPIRRMHDLHKLSGLVSSILLLIVVATGVLLALPKVAQVVIAPAAVPAPKGQGAGAGRVTVAQALAVAHRALPDGRLTFVDIPDRRSVPFRMRFQVPGDPHPRFPSSYVFVDQSSGRVLATYDVRRVGVRTAVSSWIRTLHDGTVGGLATRILAILLGLVPAFLFVTGLIHWSRRRRSVSVAKHRMPLSG